MLQAVLLFALGLVLLIKGGDWFVDGATGIAHRFHLPELLIGATVVSIGTTLPEVMVSATAAVGGHGEMAFGNAIGSVICNSALIAAITVAVRPGSVDRKSLVFPVLAFFMAGIFYAANAYSGAFPRWSGIALLLMFVLYMIVTVKQAFAHGEELRERDEQTSADEKKPPVIREIVLLAVGATFIASGARLLVDNGTLIAEALGVPESVIALTFVALGTSLPELVTAITALAKGHGALSLGNVIGANLFNLVLVSGMAISLNPFTIPLGKTISGISASLLVDIPVMFCVMGLLTLPALLRGRLARWQGVVLLLIYGAYCLFQFVS